MVKIQLKLELSEIIEDGSTCFPKTAEKEHIQYKNPFVTGVAFNIELYSRKINLPEHP